MTKQKEPTMKEMIKVINDFMNTPEYQEYKKQAEFFINIAVKIKQIREKRGLTRNQLADKMGLKPPTIARVEKSGKASVDFLNRFCNATNTNLELTFS